MRRAGRIPTGVDRVEHAYLTRFLAGDTACFGLVRTAFGYLLLDRQGLQGVLDRIEGRIAWGDCDRLSWLTAPENTIVKRAEADFRRLAVGRSTPWLLRRLCDKLPDNCTYYNVGHSNLTDRVLSALKGAGVHLAVLIHDVIPLEYPQFQRTGTVEPFRAKIQRVRQWADLVIYNSADTRDRTEAQMLQWGAVPKGVVAHLGMVPPVPDSAALPSSLPPRPPYKRAPRVSTPSPARPLLGSRLNSSKPTRTEPEPAKNSIPWPKPALRKSQPRTRQSSRQRPC